MRPVKALFNFGSRASSRPNQRASELEDEILSLVREVPVGKLSPKDADNFSDLVRIHRLDQIGHNQYITEQAVSSG